MPTWVSGVDGRHTRLALSVIGGKRGRNLNNILALRRVGSFVGYLHQNYSRALGGALHPSRPANVRRTVWQRPSGCDKLSTGGDGHVDIAGNCRCGVDYVCIDRGRGNHLARLAPIYRERTRPHGRLDVPLVDMRRPVRPNVGAAMAAQARR